MLYDYFQGSGKRHCQAMHVIDAAQLASINVSELDFDARQCIIRQFCRAIYRPTRALGPLRPREFYALDTIPSSNSPYAPVSELLSRYSNETDTMCIDWIEWELFLALYCSKRIA